MVRTDRYLKRMLSLEGRGDQIRAAYKLDLPTSLEQESIFVFKRHGYCFKNGLETGRIQTNSVV